MHITSILRIFPAPKEGWPIILKVRCLQKNPKLCAEKRLILLIKISFKHTFQCYNFNAYTSVCDFWLLKKATLVTLGLQDIDNCAIYH